MNVKLKRLLLPLLRAVKEGRPISFRMRSAAQQGLFLIGKPTPKKTSGRLRREQKRATHKEETAKIREEVFKRAEGGCEAIYGTEDGAFERCDANATDLDHWLGGSGRRRQKQSVENTWALCRDCHRMRTHGSVEFWNEIFRRHCEHYGYPVIAHIEHAEPAKAGGAP